MPANLGRGGRPSPECDYPSRGPGPDTVKRSTHFASGVIVADTSPGQSPSTQHLVSPPAQAGIFIVLTVDEGGEDTVRDVLGDAGMLTRSVAFGFPAGGLSLVVGIGAELWDRLYDVPRPAHLHTFEAIEGAKHTAVSTPGDLLLHLRADRMDLCFALAQRVVEHLDGAATIVDEVHGFRYFNAATCSASSTGRRTPRATMRSTPSSSVTRTRPTPAAATSSCRNTSTTSPRGRSSRPRSRRRSSVGASSPTSSRPRTRSRATPTSRSTTSRTRTATTGRSSGTNDRILDFSTAVTGSLYDVPTRSELEDGPGEG